MDSITVRQIAQSPEFKERFELIAGAESLDKLISVPFLQRPGLAMAGYTEFLRREQVHVLGPTEISYLRRLDQEQRAQVLTAYFDFDLACLIIARNLKLPQGFIRHADRTHTPVFRVKDPTHIIVEQMNRYLDVCFANEESVHGVLVDVHGVGILLLGRGGIGKSECALDLLLKGHRLVADDMVMLKRIPPGIVRGESSNVIKYHMEIRGLGVINVKELFGIASIRDQKKVHLVVKLVDWDEKEEYDRAGLEDSYHKILGVDLPMILLPVAPGRNISAIIEVAAKNHLLKLEGFHPAKEFERQLIEKLEDYGPAGELEEPE